MTQKHSFLLSCKIRMLRKLKGATFCNSYYISHIQYIIIIYYIILYIDQLKQVVVLDTI